MLLELTLALQCRDDICLSDTAQKGPAFDLQSCYKRSPELVHMREHFGNLWRNRLRGAPLGNEWLDLVLVGIQSRRDMTQALQGRGGQFQAQQHCLQCMNLIQTQAINVISKSSRCFAGCFAFELCLVLHLTCRIHYKLKHGHRPYGSLMCMRNDNYGRYDPVYCKAESFQFACWAARMHVSLCVTFICVVLPANFCLSIEDLQPAMRMPGLSLRSANAALIAELRPTLLSPSRPLQMIQSHQSMESMLWQACILSDTFKHITEAACKCYIGSHCNWLPKPSLWLGLTWRLSSS